MMLVKELCDKLMDQVGPDATVAIEDHNGWSRHVRATVPGPQGLVALLLMGELVVEEDLT